MFKATKISSSSLEADLLSYLQQPRPAIVPRAKAPLSYKFVYGVATEDIEWPSICTQSPAYIDRTCRRSHAL